MATSGQPREDQLLAIAAADYEVVINLALHDDPRYSLKDQASSVRTLGMEYIHIPVQFSAPTAHDLALFFDAMDRVKGRRVWVHLPPICGSRRFLACTGYYARDGLKSARSLSCATSGSRMKYGQRLSRRR